MDIVLLALHRVGPYHHARFQHVARLLNLHVLETRPTSQEYPWDFDPSGDYSIHRLSGMPHPEADPPLPDLRRQLQAVLDQLQPQVIVSVGWADRAYQRLLLAAQQRHIPLVIVSDSRQRDEPRNSAKEWLKCQLLHGYSAALVAGFESRKYLERLGFPRDAIFQPWDVVDNSFFAQGPLQEAHQRTIIRSAPCFLCVSRFVAKKNHLGLLAAYSRYQFEGGGWGLCLIGAGPLQADLELAIAQLPHPSRVQLHPFQQLSELAASYSEASAFVLASSSDQWGLVVNEAMAAGLPCLVSSGCGCAMDLIEHGRTGWCFDPASYQQLTALMHRCERQSPAARVAMVAAARKRLEAFSLEAFSSGLQQTLVWAVQRQRFSRRATVMANILSRYH